MITIDDIVKFYNEAYPNPADFEAAMLRQRLITELNQINSKIAVVQDEQNKVNESYSAQIQELAVARNAKQAEIDALEKK